MTSKIKSNIFYNHIAAERIDMIDKLCYCFWYEHQDRDGWTKNNHKALYERTKSEVMEYGYGYFIDKEKENKT